MTSELKNRIVLLVLLIIVSSCGTKKLATDGSVNSKMSAKNIIRQHYLNELDFKTIAGKLKIDYSDGDGSQGLSVSLRMEKGKAIWISAPLGIVKAYITPKRVSFYNKLENEYFDGDFSYLSNILGTELDFEKVQNLLLGQTLFNLKTEPYMVTAATENYELKPKNAGSLFKILLHIEPDNFKMASQQISQPLRKRLLNINYKNYQKIHKWILPSDIKIVAIEKEKRNTIEIEYRNIEFDQDLRFPYKIPDGYKEIVLTKNDF
ncbi:DUF4292 domain-containing protein [Kriegella sp. EG-1]|nr:DUF4292 domain-containing protein [Flavobacteriaceae bacterium EG-1]